MEASLLQEGTQRAVYDTPGPRCDVFAANVRPSKMPGLRRHGKGRGTKSAKRTGRARQERRQVEQEQLMFDDL
jgi:hypothetical protein